MSQNLIKPGAEFGRWTVLEEWEISPGGEKRWLCRCRCGTERYVLERSLRCGGSRSCGCLRGERSKAPASDLRGMVFSDLTVLRPVEEGSPSGNGLWTCRCACGNSLNLPGRLLTQGKRTHCGCKSNRGRPTNIAGQRFHRLTALTMLPQRDPSGNVMWRCQCDCGNIVDVSYNSLVYSNQKSCGCQKKEHDKKLGDYLVHVAGTSVEQLKSKKLPSDNTTGVKGVYLVHGRYMAKIVFQKKQYFLGTYSTLQQAAQARQEAEELLFDAVADHYQKWKLRADADPKWAQNNPIQVRVDQANRSLQVHMLPEL